MLYRYTVQLGIRQLFDSANVLFTSKYYGTAAPFVVQDKLRDVPRRFTLKTRTGPQKRAASLTESHWDLSVYVALFCRSTSVLFKIVRKRLVHVLSIQNVWAFVSETQSTRISDQFQKAQNAIYALSALPACSNRIQKKISSFCSIVQHGPIAGMSIHDYGTFGQNKKRDVVRRFSPKKS